MTGATTPDSEVSLNGGTFTDCTNELVEIATNSGVYYLLLTGAEMTADIVTVICKSATAGMKTTVLTLYPRKLVTIRTGTSASAGSATTTIVLDGSASAVDDFYNGMVCAAVIDGTTEVRMIGDYTGSTQTATIVGPDWITAPDNNDTFTIFQPDGVQIQQANVTHWNSLATVALPLVPTTAGRTLDVSTGGEAGVDWANVGSPTTTLALTGTTIATTQKVDIETIKTNPVVNAGTITFPTGATLASTTNITAGTITTTTNLTNLPAITAGWLTATGIAADAITAAKIADGAIDTATFASGTTIPRVTLCDTATTVTNQLTAAQIATGVWQDATAGDFTTTSSIGKSLYTAGAVPGATGGLFIAGTNAATTITTALTTTFTGNLTGTVASVVGAVGSVTGAVGSVTGNVGGNVTGSVGSIATGGIVAASFAASAITAAAIAADAITDAKVASDVTIASVTGTVGGIAGTTQTLDALQTALNSAHGSGSWATATGFSTHSAADVWAVATRILTAGTNIVLAKGVGVTGFNDITAAAAATAVWQDTTAGDFTVDTSPGKIVFSQLGGAFTTSSSSVYTTAALANAPTGGSAPTAAQVATAVWTDLLASSDFSTVASVGKLLKDDIDAAITSRMASYTQPTGFLAATFPTTVASTTNITAASGVSLAASQHVIVDSGTVTTLTNLPAITTDWLTAAGVSAAAVTKIQAGLSTYAGGDTSGTTTLLMRIPGTVQPQSGDAYAHLDELIGAPLVMTAGKVWVLDGDGNAVASAAQVAALPTTTELDAAFASLQAHGDGTWGSGAVPSASDNATAVAAVLASAHGAGSWTTATGFSTLTAADIDARLAVYDAPTKAELDAAFATLSAHGDGAWGSGAVPSAADNATATAAVLATAHGAGSWATATGFSTLDAAGVRTAVGLATANLDTQLSELATDADAVLAKMNSFTSAEIVLLSPVTTGGSFEVVRGDDYQSSEARAIPWGDHAGTWPNLTGGTVTFITERGGGVANVTKTLSVTNPAGPAALLEMELTAAETTVLTPGQYQYAIFATLANGDVVTLMRSGTMRVVDR